MSIKMQKSLINTFDRHASFCAAITHHTTSGMLQVRLQSIKDNYQSFLTIQANLEETCEEKDLKALYVDRGRVEDQYFSCVGEISERLKNMNAVQQAPIVNNPAIQKQDVKLPRIELTAFSGNYEDWPSFKDLYLTLIHTSAALSNVQKLHYLKTNVEGDAHSLLKSISITDANYDPAWKRLTDRYDHKRYIVDSHLKTFLNLPTIKTESHQDIKSLIDKSTEIVRALQVQGLPINQWDTILVHVIVSKLDSETHKQWELILRKDELPTFEALEAFLESRWQSLEMIYKSNVETNSSKSATNHNRFQQSNIRNSTFKSHRVSINTSSNGRETNQNVNKCNYCSREGHTVSSCSEYSNVNYQNKIEFIKSKKLCFNCLRSGHSLNECRSKVNCRQCGKKHHTSIHKVNNETPASPHNQENSMSTITSGVITNNVSSHRERILLSTAIILIKDSCGNQLKVRALIDSGSENSLIQTKLAKKLGLLQKPEIAPIVGVGEVIIQNSTSVLTLQIQSRLDPTFNMDIDLYTMETVTGSLPSIPVEKLKWPHLQGIKLADENFDQSSPIELLLGMEVFEEILLDGLIPKRNNSPTAMNSKLGWLLMGKVQTKVPINRKIKCLHVNMPEEKLDSALRSFWELEEIPASRKFTVQEQLAEEIFTKNVSRNLDGRYVVVLPFNPNKASQILGESRTAALRCLYAMEKRFKSNATLRERYAEYIQNLINSEHIERVPGNRLNIPETERFFLPHHAVSKESSLTTKLRVVFNASRKSTSGVSLNDKLLVGPKTQDDLFSIMVRWRKHKIVLLADVEKMYRQVKIISDHRDYQRLLWRFSPEEPILEYRVTTVIDGTASASFLATRVLNQLADDYSNQYPEASQIIKQDFYVDDLTSGSHSTQSAKKLQKDLIDLLKKGGFILRKWFSNCLEIIENVPEENRHKPESLIELMDKGIKTLGIYWNQKEDCFQFKVEPHKCLNSSTKREVLSDIAKLFDPIGWLSPVTIKAKIFMQGLWTLKNLDWEDNLPQDKYQEWQSYRNELSSLENIKIPRWLGTTSISNIQLHGFSDASNVAYSAVVYSRTVMSDTTIVVNLISGKTKVAPLKTISTPKLELCGCTMLSKLMFNVKNSIKCEGVEIHMYSDSTVALGWITSHPNHWNTFVANRVTDIQQVTNVNSWNYVDTSENPADCASRGLNPSKLEGHTLWFQGPIWLSKSQNQWPKCEQNFTTELEKRKSIKVFHIKMDNGINSHMMNYLEEHTDLSTLQRRTAYILRCLPSKKSLKKNLIQIPTAKEYRDALNCWIKFTQTQAFAEEIACCNENVELPRKSKLISLNPYIDEDGIIRVGGRLSKSALPFKSKHPIILPKSYHLTKLIIKQAHQLTLHGGPSLMSAFLTNYWIFGKSDQIKSTIKSCRICFPFTCKPQTQIMADLPKNRVTPHRPFLHTAVDFAGPISVKQFIGRSRGKYVHTNAKSYISIFVCLATKAIHIELASDMSSIVFIAAYKRFTAIRGKCSDLYSDCGTNFVGANRILRAQFKKLQKDSSVQNYLAEDGTTWHFNPPASPHFGGLHEAGVKSIKYHLKRLIGNDVLTYEEMITILSQISACLNSRPLCQLSNDIYDMSYLTPGHFILGDAPITVPEPSLLNTNINRLSRWQLVQRIYQQFWKYWSTDYLSKLQQRLKWTDEQENVKVGQMVLYRQDNLPPTKWPIAKIVQVHPDSDGKVRVVTIQTANSTLTRPIVKLSVLPEES